jgi:ABC-type Fe3+/spermidine/putrescine transport system ATPase subunit
VTVSKAKIVVKDLVKKFGSATAVDNVSFEVYEGEMLSLLGPSGCGKSTTLRCIAGLEKPNSGEILMGDMALNSSQRGIYTPPDKRGLGMVFQSYAVWPHMTVFENVAFPLTLRRVPAKNIREKVMATLKLVGLDGFENRGATMLSGGQQQRVALARALVYDPEVLLLDEPLSNLDVKLRESMRVELRALQRRLGITAIFVTHDQSEAFVLSDRVAVMNRGKIVEIRSPREIYERPESQFTMDFVGTVNYLKGKVVQMAGAQARIALDGTSGVELVCRPPEVLNQGENVLVCARIEDVSLMPLSERTPDAWMAEVKTAGFLGSRIEYVLQVGDQTVKALCPASANYQEESKVCVQVNPDSVRIWRNNDN